MVDTIDMLMCTRRWAAHVKSRDEAGICGALHSGAPGTVAEGSLARRGTPVKETWDREELAERPDKRQRT
jgi:hypothetical protein